MKYFLEIAYHGGNYHGWQIQPNALTVQGVLEDCLSKLLGYPIETLASGRTDTGVHCEQQFVQFVVPQPLQNQQHFLHRLNAFLPEDILIRSIRPVKEEANARFDAIWRSYRYQILLEKSPFHRDTAWRLYKKPDIERLNEASTRLIGKRDYEAFSKTGSDVKTHVCHIQQAYWEERSGMLFFHITADRFLRGMVRILTGTLLEIGYHKMPISELERLIEEKDRSRAKHQAPPHGLFLARVVYPDHIWL
ncbi:MAG: tRNA pseudouridine(38-40) synthase TruA [Flammeovirgaceae bacterium]|nr:tRNA pseudouridine(38-40) synthase TruA [Flammeovirgaceae bacterium]MDW8288411.1 tRNA pseudouridine(38-40) synthase TruA [Flammeovirgaceae bacterium]